ncbi:twin-arginine translocase subunit TatC [soil metagenome]
MTITKTKKRPKRNPTPKVQPFSEHLVELRSRILWCVLVLIVGTSVGWFLHEDILAILIKPLHQTVFYTSPTGGFNFVINISLFFGFLLSLPMFVYQSIRFIEPALPKKFPRLFLTIFTASSVLLLLGMSFAYFVSLPAALYFLNTFSTNEIKALISTDEYFSFVTRYLLGFGLVFQLPLIMLAINSVRKISTKELFSIERIVIVVSFVIAAVLTPTPDILNQVVMALPIIILYQISTVAIILKNRI